MTDAFEILGDTDSVETHWWCERCRSSGFLHEKPDALTMKCPCGGRPIGLSAIDAEVRRAEPIALALIRRIEATKRVESPQPRDAYTMIEAARRLSIGMTKMKSLLRKRQIISVVIGKRRCIPATELQRILTTAPKSRSRAPAPPPPPPMDGAAIRDQIFADGNIKPRKRT